MDVLFISPRQLTAASALVFVAVAAGCFIYDDGVPPAGVRLIKPMETPDSSIKRISTRHDVLSAILWLQCTGEKKDT